MTRSPARCLRLRSRSSRREPWERDRKSTRLNSSHGYISYAVFCLKKKKIQQFSVLTPSNMLIAHVSAALDMVLLMLKILRHSFYTIQYVLLCDSRFVERQLCLIII